MLFYKILTLRLQLEEALNRNKELERKNNSYKQKTKRIESGTKE